MQNILCHAKRLVLHGQAFPAFAHKWLSFRLGRRGLRGCDSVSECDVRIRAGIDTNVKASDEFATRADANTCTAAGKPAGQRILIQFLAS